MAQPLNPHNGVHSLNKLSFCYNSFSSTTAKSKLLQKAKSCFHRRYDTLSRCQHCAQSISPGVLNVEDHVKRTPEFEEYVLDGVKSNTFPHVQTLRRFPREELVSKVVLVRFDSSVLLGEELDLSSQSVSSALFTIRYLHEVGARVILLSNWNRKNNSEILSVESVADILSVALQYKVLSVQSISCKKPVDMDIFKKADIIILENLMNFKEEVANCPKFSKLLSSGVDILVNDSFSQSHKILASTVGVAQFCYASLAGFHFEESLCQLKKVAKLDKKPYYAIIGGGNLHNKATALRCLASCCDGLVFVGMMAFQIMHALGLPVTSDLVEKEAYKAALDLIQFAHEKNISILYPKDFWCMNDHLPKQLEIFPAQSIVDGWVPVDLGPQAVEEMKSLIMKCKKILWIGPVKYKFSGQHTSGASKLATMLSKLGQNDCDITIVGNIACNPITKESSSGFNVVESASVVWEFLKGRKLHGVLTLDRGYPFEVDWNAAYCDPTQPLVVDIGSGNGLFLLGMARKRKDLNFLGLEINAKLVRRCLDSVHLSGKNNGYFIATNATSTFRSIVSSYPGKLILVSIQACSVQTLISIDQNIDGECFKGHWLKQWQMSLNMRGRYTDIMGCSYK
ncbi:phosphoglycerate kinase-like isoform X2 [Mangifera indica]|uniref:phosphoglycerate kinase-like isoform X2 n=1 Tax=Mangifera indica TaxID=29780 RepID=UPI001CFB0C06|nr:phosphoglycerate kinase-like isoform X2 [Mangifera indica]